MQMCEWYCIVQVRAARAQARKTNEMRARRMSYLAKRCTAQHIWRKCMEIYERKHTHARGTTCANIIRVSDPAGARDASSAAGITSATAEYHDERKIIWRTC